MTFARRIIAVFLMAIFAPSTVLAAAPLVLCLGDNGRQAIEVAHLTSSHDHERPSFNIKNAATTKASIQSDCRDTALFSVQSSPRRSALSKVSSPNAFAILPIFFKSAHFASVKLSSDLARRPSRADRVDPRLIDLSSVVLRN